ncbi:MAG: hypothetical protein WC556_03085 [Candidatus Methanoperedens sp.]
MELLNNLKIRFVQYKLASDISVRFCVICALIVGILTYFLPIAKGDNILYLLSSVSQGLAAVFALVFTITVFGAQMMQKFTALDKMIDRWTKALMIMFAIGIILPLIQLKTDYDLFNLSFVNTANLSLAIDLSIATFCVLAIIPYLARVNRFMKYEVGIPKLGEEISVAIDSNFKITASNKINELVELGISAVNEMSENETTKIVIKLKNAGQEFAFMGWDDVTNIKSDTFGEYNEEFAGKGWGRIAYDVLYGLQKIGSKSIERKLDRTTKEVMWALTEIGVQAVLKEDKEIGKADRVQLVVHIIARLKEFGINAINSEFNNDIVSTSLEGLFKIGIKNAMKNSFLEQMILVSVMSNIEEIADKAYEKNREKFKNQYESSLMYLWIFWAFIKNDPNFDIKEMASDLRKSEKHVMKEFGNENIRSKAREFIKNFFPTLINELKAFEEMYDGSLSGISANV